jgi:predicted translin family RNA/ssDNA-binding protein
MSLEPPKTHDDIEKTLDELIVYLQQAKSEIEADVEIELDGLEDSVQNVCDAVKKSPQELKDKVEPKMSVMVKELEALAETLKEHPDVVHSSATDEE